MNTITYNTALPALSLTAYGRMVQQMVNHLLTIENPVTRQRTAERIIRVMDVLNPSLRSRPDHWDILWNHLARMAHYKLDVEYPCVIENRENEKPAHKLSYPGHKIRYRHYGALVELAVEQLAAMPENAPRRNETIRNVAARMRRCLAQWRGEQVDNEKVARDLEEYTNGRVTAAEVLEQLTAIKTRVYSRPGAAERRPRFVGKKKGYPFK